MTLEDAAEAWYRQLARIAPRVDLDLVRSIARQLAGGGEAEELQAIMEELQATSAELQALAAQLVAIAGVVAEEATCEASPA